MIRELLQTVGNPDVFFATNQHPFYRHKTVSNEQYGILNDYHYGKLPPIFDRLSFGQTRDFINAVADELGEPL